MKVAMKMSDYPDVIDIVIEIIDGQLYVSTDIPNDTHVALTVYDYDTAEHVSLEAAKEHTVDWANGAGAVAAAHQAWHEYVCEREVPLVP